MDNYNSLANCDDGSCKYEGCLDNAENYSVLGQSPSPWANYVCVDSTPAPDLGGGASPGLTRNLLCTSPTNTGEIISSKGKFEDGLVFLSTPSNPSSINTYTDPTSTSTQINGMCTNIVTTITSGCTDPLANNYDPSATNDCEADSNYPNNCIDPTNPGPTNGTCCCTYTSPTYDCGPDGVINPTGGGNITPMIGCQLNPNGTGQYTGATAFADCQAVCKSCTEVTAKKCNGTTIRNYTCDGQGGSDGLTIDGFEGDHTGAPGQVWINTVTAPYFIGQRFKVKEKLQPAPNDGPKSLQEKVDEPTSFWVSYEVMTIQEKFSTNTTRKEGKGTQCFPLTYDCRCLSIPCPEGSQITPFSLGVSTGGGHKHYCTPNTEGTGQSATLNECLSWCPCEASGRKYKIPGKPIDPFLLPTDNPNIISAKKVDSCPGHTGRDILPKSCDNPKYYFDKKTPDIKEPEIIEPIDIDTVEPVDIDRPTEPTGSVDVPEKPTITPDTPELKESKKLRKLIKKWRKNNL